MKKFFSVFSVIVLSMFNIISPATYALEGDESSESCFTIEDGFITNYLCSETNLTIPSSIDGVNVVGIGAQAFRGKGLTSVIIEEGIQVIGKWAFAENQLNSIDFPSSLKSIEEAAFNKNLIDGNDAFIYTIGSNRLVSYAGTETSIIIPTGTISIGASAFRDMGITDVTIPNSVTNIGYMAFAGNELTNLLLPSNIMTIGAYAFERNNLSSLFLPNSIQEVDKEAFCDQKSTSEVDAKIVRDFGNEFNNTCLNVDRIYSLTFKDHDNIVLTGLYNEGEIIEFPTGDYAGLGWFDGETQYSDGAVMPEKDLELNAKALSGCFIIDNSIIIKYICDETDIIIPNQVDGQNVVGIGTGVFEDRGVTSLTFETQYLENIYKNAFAYNSLTQVDIPNTVKYIGNSAFRSRDDDTSVKIISLNLGNSVEIIDEHAFAYNRITTLNIPSSVERIEKGAFRDNRNIKDLVIPSNVKFIGEAAFRNNDEMTNLTIEDGLEEVGTGAFYNDRLKNINIPNSVKYIRDSAFRNNTYNNYTVSIGNGLEYLGQWAFCKGQAISGGEAPICDDRAISIDSESLERLGGVDQIAIDHVDRDGPYLIINSYTYHTVSFRNGDTEVSSGKYLSGDTIIYPADLRDNDKIFDGWDPNLNFMPDADLIINAKWINKATSGSCFGTAELGNGMLQITSYDISCGVDVIIPKTINGKSVTSIKDNSFLSKGISSVVIPYSVTSIGTNAFRGNNNIGLVKIVNPNIQFVPEEASFWHGNGAVINFLVPESVSDLSIFQKAAYASNRGQATYSISTGWLVYYRDGSDIIDVELYRNNADLGDSPVLNDKDGYKFLGWNGIPTNGKVTSNLNLTAIWKDVSTNITPDECFIVETKNSGGVPYTNIQGYKEFCGDEVIIPNIVNGGTVNVLSNAPFKNKNLKKIVLPNTLVTIGQEGISYNSLLTGIELPDSLQSIGARAFRNNGFIGTLQLPNNITSISENAFYGNAIDTVLLGENITSIGAGSFCGRTDGGRTKALLPKSISEYPSDFPNQLNNACLDYVQKCIIIFEDGEGNTLSEAIYGEGDEIVLPDFDTNKEGYQFLGWRGLPSDGKAKSTQTLTPLWKAEGSEDPDECFIYDTDDYTLIDYVEGCEKDIILPSKTKVIKKDALKGRRLTSVTLNDGLLIIEQGAFENNSLTGLNLPSSITSFDPNSLSGNYNLEKVRNSSGTTPDTCFTVHAANGKYQILGYNTNCGSDVIIPGIITSSIGGSVPTRNVWSIAGFGSYIIKKVEIPMNVTRIAANTFYGANLSEVVLHDGITEIGNNAFGGNENLERVFVGSGLLNSGAVIGSTVFCKNSSDITKRIGIVATENYELITQDIKNKFDSICVDLEPRFTVIFNDTDGTFIEERIYGSGETIITPDVANNENGKVIGWIGLPTNMVITGNLTVKAIRKVVGEYTPEECFTIENGIIIDYIKSCGTDIVIPSTIDGQSVESIGDSVFKNMGITSLRILDGIKKIGNSAFEGNNLKSLIIPDSITEIGDNAFNSNQLETLKLSKNISSIGDFAFANNELTAVRIPLSIDTVGDYAFCSATNSPVEGLISEDFPESKYGNFKNSCIELVKGLYLIIFDTAGGTTIPAIEGEYKDPIDVSIPNPIWKGYRFLGWDKTVPAKMPADDMVITALWGNRGYSGRGRSVDVKDTNGYFDTDGSQNSSIISGDNNISTGKLDSLKNKILTRGNLAVITDMIVTKYPQLINKRPIINTNCIDYSDYSTFTNREKKAIEKLCRVGIMGIHNDTTKPLTTFKVNKIVPLNQFQLVMERTFIDYKDSILLGIMQKVQGKNEIDLLTIYEVVVIITKGLK